MNFYLKIMKTRIFIATLLIVILASCASNKYTCPTYSVISDEYEMYELPDTLTIEDKEEIAAIVEKDAKNRQRLHTAFGVFGIMTAIVLTGGF